MSTSSITTLSSLDMGLLPRSVAARLNGLVHQLNNLLADIEADRRPEMAAALARRAQVVADEIETLLKTLVPRIYSAFVVLANALNACGAALTTAVLSVVSTHPVPRLRFVLSDQSLARPSLENTDDDAVRAYRLG